MTVSDIIGSLGGTSAVAKYAGWPVSTVDTWVTKDYIPEWRQPAILRMALEKGVALSTADFPARARRIAA